MFLLLIVIGGCQSKNEHKVSQNKIPIGNLKVAVLIYDGVGLLDFAGASDVFSNTKGFSVYTVAVAPDKIRTNNGSTTLDPDYTLANAPAPDILLVPGAGIESTTSISNNQSVISWIKKTSSHAKVTMSVCTGAQLLGKAGILDNKSVTTHSGAVDSLEVLFPKAKFVRDVRYVQDGKLLTTAGISAGIDCALHVVDNLRGMKAALFTAAILEYDKWNPGEGMVMGKPMKMAGMQMQGMMPAQPMPGTRTEILPAETKDPVCGMTLAKGSASKYHMTYRGKEYHFCSATCLKSFENYPQVFSKNQQTNAQ